MSVSRVSSVLIAPPMTFEPRPRTATGADALAGWPKSVSLAARQACPSATRCESVEPVHARGEGGRDGVGQGEVHVVAAEQDVLADGQPRQRSRSPPWSVTAIRVKSVVPPPTSQTRRMSPTLTAFRQASPWAASQA